MCGNICIHILYINIICAQLLLWLLTRNDRILYCITVRRAGARHAAALVLYLYAAGLGGQRVAGRCRCWRWQRATDGAGRLKGNPAPRRRWSRPIGRPGRRRTAGRTRHASRGGTRPARPRCAPRTHVDPVLFGIPTPACPVHCRFLLRRPRASSSRNFPANRTQVTPAFRFAYFCPSLRPATVYCLVEPSGFLIITIRCSVFGFFFNSRPAHWPLLYYVSVVFLAPVTSYITSQHTAFIYIVIVKTVCEFRFSMFVRFSIVSRTVTKRWQSPISAWWDPVLPDTHFKVSGARSTRTRLFFFLTSCFVTI